MKLGEDLEVQLKVTNCQLLKMLESPQSAVSLCLCEKKGMVGRWH
jgi:hypothetical protein